MKSHRQPPRNPSRRLHSLTVTAVVMGLATLAGCGGTAGDGYPTEPTVTAVGVNDVNLVSGGVGTFTATVQSGVRAERVVVDFYLVDAATGGCSQLGQAAASTVPFDLAYNLLESSPSPSRQARFFTTGLTYSPETGLREAKILQAFQLPILPDGSYSVVGAVRGKEPACKRAGSAVPVTHTTQPRMIHSYTKASNHSFRLPPAVEKTGKNRPGPALSISSEIANVGLVHEGDTEVGFLLEIDGVDYPLEVEQTDAAGGSVRVSRHTYARKERNGSVVPMMQGDVRGTTHHLHLGEAAKEKLRAATTDKTCTLKITIDPDHKIAAVGGQDSMTSVPVQFLAAAAPCPVDPSLPNVQYCYGPGGSNANSNDNGNVFGSYQFANTAADPNYLAATPATPSGVPSTVKQYSNASSAFGASSNSASKLISTQLVFAVTPGQPASAADRAATAVDPPEGEVDGSEQLQLLGSLVFDRDFKKLTAERDYTFYKKNAKKVLWKTTTMVGPVPVKAEIGIEGELGLQGQIKIVADRTGWGSLGFAIGPYAGVKVYAEASVNLVVCQVGVGFEMTVVKFSVEFQLGMRLVISGAQAALEIYEGIPLTITALGGDIYLFVKVPLIHEWKYPFVEWAGWTWVFNIVPPQTTYFGSPGTFMVTGTHSGAPIAPRMDHMVYADASQAPVYSSDNYLWEGNIALTQSRYRFSFQGVNNIQLSGNGIGSKTILSSCSSGGSTEVDIAAAGTYTLQVKTDYACWKSGSASVSWAEMGESGVGSAGGYAGTADGSPACAVNQWLYNDPAYGTATVPTSYQCASDVDLQVESSQQMAAWINAPQDGLTALWQGAFPTFDASVTEAVVWFQGNPTIASCVHVGTADRPPTYYSNKGDMVELAVTDATGAVIFTTDPANTNSVDFGSSGNGFLKIDLNGKPPYAYSLRYHPLGNYECAWPPYRDAALKMTVVPLGRWLIQTSCANGTQAPVTLPGITLDGPVSSASGTLNGGSVSSVSRCQVAGYDTFVNEHVVGGFDFGALSGGSQDFDFFFGSNVPHAYQGLVDGARLSSRASADPATLTDPCSTYVCTAREGHATATLSQGYHVVEGYYANFKAADGTMKGMFSDNRIRWAPAGSTNRTLGYFYASASELAQALAGDAQGGGPAPLMILDNPTGVPPSLHWSDLPNDCDATVNGQLDCLSSLMGVTGGYSAFSVLWDGHYAMADQVPYLYTLSTNRNQVDVWVDGLEYSSFQTGLSNPQPFQPYPQSSFYGVLLNKQPPTQTGLNAIRVAVSNNGIQGPYQVDSSWTAAAPGTYMVVFLDEGGVPLDTATGNHGTGATQSICIGTGCPNATDVNWIRADATAILVLASPIADPAGALQGTDGVIDMIVDAQSNVGAGQALVDLCANGWCGTGYAPTGRVTSPQFFPYTPASSTSSATGLLSQQANSLVFRIDGPPTGWPAGTKFQFSLGYQSHAW